MEKLAILSHVLYNKDLLDKTNTLQMYTIKKIKMSNKHYEEHIQYYISQLITTTYNDIIYREHLYWDLSNTNNTFNTIFTTEYYDKIEYIFSQFIPDQMYSKLVITITKLMFNCIRSNTISFATLWSSVIARDDSFYNILDNHLNNVIHIQMKCMEQTYFDLY